MKNTFRFCLLAIVLIFIFFQSAVSQTQPAAVYTPKVGISASLQNDQIDILVPIWLGTYVSVSPGIGVQWTQDVGTDLRASLVPRFYLMRKRVSPYIGVRAEMLRAMPSVGTETTDWLAGLSIGGEYFIDYHFSFGIESQVNLTISDDNSVRFGNPGKQSLSTAAAIFATVYF